MAKMKRNQDDKDLLIQLMDSLGTDGLKPTSKVSKEIEDLIKEGFKPNLKSRGKPRAFNNGGAVMSGRGPKFKGIT